MRWGLICLLLLVALNGTAQVWNKTYIEDRSTMLFSSVYADDTAYKVIGVTAGSVSNQAKGIVANIDLAGSLTYYKPLGDSVNVNYGLFWNALIKIAGNKLAFTGYRYDSIPSILFGIASSNLDSIIEFTYHVPNSSALQGYKLIQLGNEFYISGVHTDRTVNSADNFLIKIDSAGNKIWEKYYGVSNRMEYAKSLVPLSNGHLMLGSLRNDFNQPNEHSNTWLLEVDTGGNFVREWFDPNDSTYAAEGLRQTQDGGFIYGAQKKNEQTINSVFWNSTVVKMDSNFQQQWIHTEGYKSLYTAIVDIQQLIDGSFIACGQKPLHPDSNVLCGWVIKLSYSGQVVWNNTYRAIDATSTLNFLTDIDVLPDGSLIAVGQCQQSGQTPPQVGWFLKLDSNGCEIENCLVGIDELTPKSPKGDLNSQIQVWPNPFNTDLSLTLSEGEGIIPTATFTITTITGQVVYQQQENSLAPGYTKMLDLNYLPNGVYFVEVSTAKGTAVQRVVKQ